MSSLFEELSFTSSPSATGSESPSQTGSASASQTASGSPSQSGILVKTASTPVGVTNEGVVYISIVLIPIILALLYFGIRKLQRRISNLNAAI